LPQAGACNVLEGRKSADGSSRVFAEVYADKVILGCYVGGTRHVIETALGAPSPASRWELQLGTEENDRNFLVYQNRKTIIDNDDTNPSLEGSAYRSAGQAMISGAGGQIETSPGDIAQWSLRDLAPPSVIGTGMRVKNLAATTYVMTHGVISSIPNGYFDSVDYCSADIDWDASLTQATLNTEGHYLIEFDLLFNTFYPSVTIYPALFQNTAALLGGPISASAGTDSQFKTAFGSFSTYGRPGDVILPGMGIASSGDITVTGDATGILSWLTITKVG
jgi:hypothetical protein